MDPEANEAEQLELAHALHVIHDNVDDKGFTDDQLEEVVELAFRLAALVESLHEWSSQKRI